LEVVRGLENVTIEPGVDARPGDDWRRGVIDRHGDLDVEDLIPAHCPAGIGPAERHDLLLLVQRIDWHL
jgi:hypothetical protein